MLEVQLELVAAKPVWSPELQKNSSSTGVRDMVESWLKGMVEIGTLIKRLETGEGMAVPCGSLPPWFLAEVVRLYGGWPAACHAVQLLQHCVLAGSSRTQHVMLQNLASQPCVFMTLQATT
jgi:hypothetical protein